MSTYSKIALSGSTNGRGVKVAATSIGTGTTIHTASGAVCDLVTLFVSNKDTAAHTLTIGWGGTSDPDDLIVQQIPQNSGLILVTADLLINNSLIVKAAADVASKLVIFGYVNQIN